MIKSMTGYGIERQIIDGREVTVEIKSVNNRYFDFQCSYPRSYGYLENKMKNFVADDINRGRVFVNISIFTIEDRETNVVVDEKLAENYIFGMRAVKEKLNLKDDLSLSSLLRIKDVFSIKKELPDEEVIWSSVKIVAQIALEKFVEMTTNEGRELKKDILERLSLIKKQIVIVEKETPKSVKIYRENLYAKLSEILKDSIDDARILTEAAIFADKIATEEETVRLKSHLFQMEDLVNSDDTVIGRKMDFIVQELNREANTIGSKSQNIEITKTVVDMKSEIEKIREQIQNIV